METGQLRIPDDPTGIEEAHDILAAEDFAMPSGPDWLAEKLRRRGALGPGLAFAAAALVAFAWVVLRRR